MRNFLRVLGILSGAALLIGCSFDAIRVNRELSRMSLREKVGMLFFIRPEALDPSLRYKTVTALQEIRLQTVNERMRETARTCPAGGIILFAHNIGDEAQLQEFIADLRSLDGNPLLGIDEEGGRVARIGQNPAFPVPRFPSIAALAAEGNPGTVGAAAKAIGQYLKAYGFDVDFAPVADVNTNPENIIIGDRAFSSDPEVAATMVKSYLGGLQEAGILGCLKHFPGHGDTQADTHLGYAMSRKDWDEISACEMVPFRAGIEAGAPLVMTAHISLPRVTGTEVPSTLSPLILQEKLRRELHFNGVIITDAMEMGAITQQYSVEEACILAIQAGADMLLCVREYPKVFETVLAAVEREEIPEARIDESVRRILHLRHLAGLSR